MAREVIKYLLILKEIKVNIISLSVAEDVALGISG
jgi:hypothetical protein